jgi:iron complex outermembrane receptor protein
MQRFISISVLLFCMSISGVASEHSHHYSDGEASEADTLIWEGAPMTIQEAVTKASFAAASPLRLATIDSRSIMNRSWSRTYPELIGGVPGVYATSESGSYGDARLNIRGFAQENIAVLLNGIPISGLTTGGMYWNNWMGLAEATDAIQLQKGVGSSMLSDCSVGGTVNIVTTTAGETFSVNAGLGASDFGTAKTYVKVSSGRLPHGWSIMAMGSYVGGRGYVECTDVNSFAFMLNVNKIIDSKNTLIFNVLGSPEHHGQRSTRLSYSEVEQYGRRYSRDWGWKDGERFGLGKNNYFKPYFTLQHMYSSGKLTLRNSLYFSIGDGGGRWRESAGNSIYSYTTADGLIDWDAVVADNALEETQGYGTRAQNILSDYQAGHTQSGAIISGEVAVGKGWKLGFGAHYQNYRTWEREKITDLLGADYWYEDYSGNSLMGLAGRNPYKKVGDYIRTWNGKHINHGTLYASARYESGKLAANLGASMFGSTNQRWDKYNYSGDDVYSKVATGLGASFKGGLLWHINKANSVYFNSGFYSRLPYPSTFFSSGNNSVSNNVRNEKNILGEAGYRFVFDRGCLETQFYTAYWKDRTLMSSRYKQQNEEDSRYMVTGLDALHYGIEAEGWWNISSWMKLSAFASFGSWHWKNDVNAIIYDEYTGLEAASVNVYSDGLPVSGAPQTQAGASVDVKLPAGFSVSASWRLNARMYADFDPAMRTDASDRAYPYRIPSSNVFGGDVRWSGRLFGNVGCELFMHCSNIFDSEYIERGRDGATHDRDTFTGFWGFGRNMSFGLRINI